MKKISYIDAAYILNYKQRHLREKYLCNWYMELRNCNVGFMECRLKWWTYILLFVPVHILKFLYCLWDGGIKEFEIESRTLHQLNIVGGPNDGDETQFGRLKIIDNMAR